MKIKELIAILQKENPENEVFLSSDPEGNNIRAIPEDSCIGNMIYEQYEKDDENNEEFDFWDADWTADDADMPEDNWEEIKNTSPRCVVIYPRD